MQKISQRFDLLIIGGGAGGFAAATRATELGARAALINYGLPLGGTCVNVGCVPSKVLLEMGSEYYYPQHIRFKAAKPVIRGRPGAFAFQSAIKEKDRIVSTLRKSNYIQVARGLTGLKIIEGQAKFISASTVEVKGQRFTAEKFIIATGSRPRILPFKGIDKVQYITSREALSLRRLPDSMVIIGAGPLGLEFAQMYARFGTRVTLLEKENQILPQAEPEIASELQRCLEEEGIAIHTGVNIFLLSQEGSIKRVEASLGGETRIFEGEELLLATGVTPNSDDMGLEEPVVEKGSGGFIKVDSEMKTTAPYIWAAGDVVGKAFLETVAAREGYLAATNALEDAHKTIDYDSIPRAAFTDPQAASVGITEEEEMRRLKACACRTIDMSQVPKAQAIKETRGKIKMVIHPETQVITGVHIVAPMAADLIHEAAMAVKFKLTINDIIETVHVFPTMSEAIKRVAQSFLRDLSKMSCCVE